MTQRILNRDPVTGLTRYFTSDDEQFTITTVRDDEPVLESNHEHRLNTDDTWKGDTHRVASIPLTVFMDLQAKGIIEDENAFKRWLNDPENAVFRTRGGKV